jgi:hypothetical protein
MADITPVSLKAQLRIKGVELLKTQINLPSPEFSPKEFQFNIDLETRFDPVQKIAIIVTSSEVKADSKPELLAVVSSACIFGIDNFDEVFKIVSEDKIDAPDEIMYILISISISTMRGVMFEQFRGTYLHGAVLPIIDPKQFKYGQQK